MTGIKYSVVTPLHHMNALVMAGGRGSRMSIPFEKPTILGMIRRVIDALHDCDSIQEVVVATTEYTPRTKDMISGQARIITTPGMGYSADLAVALNLMEGPTMILSADMPLLDRDITTGIASLYDDEYWVTILAPVTGHGHITITHEGVISRYTGISMVNASVYEDVPPVYHVMYDVRVMMNINTIQDVERLLNASHNLPKDLCL